MIFKKKIFPLSKRAIALIFLSSVAFLFLPILTNAQIGVVPRIEGLGEASLVEIIVNLIQLALSFLGLIALVIIIYAGFIWMTSGGNEQKIDKAKGIMRAGIIGLIIILLSYAIATFIVGHFINLTYYHGDDGDGGYNDTIGGTFGNGALGGGVIEYHYPERNQRNVPRNTMIMVTFKVAIATSTIVGDGFSEGAALCQAYTSNNTNGNACGELINIDISVDNNLLENEDAVVVLQQDGKSILIKPINLLGFSDRNSRINVHLKQGIKSAATLDNEEKEIFTGLNNGYSWYFDVSTFSDTTPPKVSKIWPQENATVARNAIVKITFSEPINILSVYGGSIRNIVVSSDETEINGELIISNGYKTVEFFSSVSCGGGITLNSCGENVFCLPADSTIDVLVRAGDLLNLLSGINDAAGNFLDGNMDGLSSGSLEDDYSSYFNTNNSIDITPPQIISIAPSNDASSVKLNTGVSATFNKPLSASSVKSSNFYIYKFNGTTCGEFLVGDLEEESLPVQCFPNYTTFLSNDNDAMARIKIQSPFLEKDSFYRPRITSRVKDVYGNCFNPSTGPGGTGQQ